MLLRCGQCGAVGPTCQVARSALISPSPRCPPLADGRINSIQSESCRRQATSASTSGRGWEREHAHRQPYRTRCSAKKSAEAPVADKDVSQEAGGELAPAQEGYYSIALEGCEYLFGVTIDGRLNLRDAYVVDFATGVYAQPMIDDDVPETAALYHELPWNKLFLGDRMMLKDPWEKTMKVYLIQMKAKEPCELDLEKVFVLDSETRDVRVAQVAAPNVPYDMSKMVLRIRREGLILQPIDLVPDADALMEEMESSSPPQQQGQQDIELEGPLDPIDARDDFDGPNDIPAVDLE